jgi:hypothetical protein
VGRNIILTDQGTLEFKEAKANGAHGLIHKAPASLAASYTLTWPGALPASNKFVQCDNTGTLTFAAGSTATLQNAYEAGAKITTASATPVEIEIGAASGNVGLLIDQDDDFKALDITKDGPGAGDAISILNSGTGRGLFIDQDGAAVGLEIDQDGAGVALSINQATANGALNITQAADANAVNITKSGAAAGGGIAIINAGTGEAVRIQQDGAGKGIFIDQNGAEVGLDIDQDGAAIAATINQATDNIGLNITQAGNAVALDINKTGAGAGTAVDIDSDGIGIALNVNQSSSGAVACQITSAASGDDALKVDHSGTGRTAKITHSNAGDAGNCLELNSSNDGVCLFVNQDGTGPGVRIDSESTDQPLLDLLPVTGNSRGDISFSTARTADPASPSEGDIWYNAYCKFTHCFWSNIPIERSDNFIGRIWSRGR